MPRIDVKLPNVMTVRGPISPNSLGRTLIHEHLLIDLSCWNPSASTDEATVPIEMKTLYDIRTGSLVSEDNLRLTDKQLAMKELSYFIKAGGNTLTDVTSVGIGRDPLALREISEAVGVNIIAGCGYYISTSHPGRLADQSIDEISSQIVQDISRGIEDTGIRAGIIGEIGTSVPIHPTEEKVLRASARAHLETGCAISVHVFGYPVSKETTFEILGTFKDEGVSLDRVAVCHMDQLIDLEFHKDILKKGAYIEYDCFGREEYSTRFAYAFPRDIDRVEAIAKLAKSGYMSKVLVSQDICVKTSLKEYGGYGYDHLFKRVLPMMKRAGLGDAEIEMLLVDNPSTFLSF